MANYRFGKHPPQNDYRTLRFKTYIKAGIASPPTSLNTLTRVYANIKVNDPTKLFPMDGNDTLGDCTIAGVAHAITTYRALTKKKTIPATNTIEKLYFHLTGGPDTGLNELDVLLASERRSRGQNPGLRQDRSKGSCPC